MPLLTRPGRSGSRLPARLSRLRGTGGTWTVDHAPNAGGQGFSDIPGGITAIDGQLWLAGMYTTATSNELPLIEHR